MYIRAVEKNSINPECPRLCEIFKIRNFSVPFLVSTARHPSVHTILNGGTQLYCNLTSRIHRSLNRQNLSKRVLVCTFDADIY